MNIQFRIAQISDLPFLDALEKECFSPMRQSNRRSLRLSLQSRTQEVWIVQHTVHGQSIGVGSVTIHIHRKSLRIFSIGVFKEYRRHSVGHKILEHVFDLAKGRGYNHLTLEADEGNRELIEWYKKNGFAIKTRLPDYYAKDEHAIRMVKHIDALQSSNNMGGSQSDHNVANVRNIVVVDDVAEWDLHIEMTKVVSAKNYISEKRFQNISSVRVFNLCKSYRYQSLGYYVSLLASARDHRVMPTVTTISDFQHISIVQNLASELNDLIQKSLAHVHEDRYVLYIFFGQSPESKMSKLSAELFKLFESPLLEVIFVKSDNWGIKKISPLSLYSVGKENLSLVQACAEKYFARKRFHRTRLKSYQYDLAILHNPEEEDSPSCHKALEKFRQAAEKTGFYTEMITRRDYDRIGEFDALFIRETTSVNNYTYQFSRRAYADGLVVIDDPWSILRCSNKMYLYERMNRGRIKMPGTWMLCKGINISSQAHDIIYPVVLKKPDGSFSRNMFKVNDAEELKDKLAILFKDSELIIAQQFVRSDFDWRIGMLDQSPLFACKYFMAPGHWQIYNWNKSDTDDKAGDSETIPVNQVPASVLDVAVKASSFIGDGLYGVDLKEVNEQIYLLEVNDNPNIDHGIEDKVLGNEIYLRIMQSFYNRIEKARSSTRYVCGGV